MISPTVLRDRIVSRLTQDLVGPLSDAEILLDRPTQRYSTGILYPQGSAIDVEEDRDGGEAVNEAEDSASNPDTGGVSLISAMKPSSAGLSFAVQPLSQDVHPLIDVEVKCATYRQFAVDESGKEIEGPPHSRASERWRRVAQSTTLSVELVSGETRIDLGPHGLQGMELYVLTAVMGDLLTATAALSNRRNRGDSSAFDEQQHFFQVEMAIKGVTRGAFAPRPSRRPGIDDDSKTAVLIYRDVKQYVVGHTCSAQPVLLADGRVDSLRTEWIPSIEVPGVSDRGDSVFDQLRADNDLRTLEAAWLSTSQPERLIFGLRELTKAYRLWIARESDRADKLPSELQAQARRHIALCARGAERIEEGIEMISRDADVRGAFQMAQEAMGVQFRWQRNGEALVWRPFQLAFQLLVLPSLAVPSHTDRDIMDLLWFPTGGGKTEAYLALTAFAILLRRLRRQDERSGAGVVVLMRYTLRLLTIQQFQRAAALICACEMLRRLAAEKGRPLLGVTPIGLGLWVGAAATPLTLRDAMQHSLDDTSDPKQLTVCPCCGAILRWRISPTESVVECPSSAIECQFGATGARIPIWTIDEEVYRHAPSILIGTVDKFAQIVRKLETGAIFGRDRGCAPPDFIIQDELHLISGPLGSITGLYEVAIDELCRRNGVRPKIVGSTATIRRAAEQARALFDRETYQFPSPGLEASNSAFAVTNTLEPGRLYLGVSTAGRSATYMLQAIAASLVQAAGQASQSDGEPDNYWTLVIYFNSLRELGRALVLMQDDVPVSIAQLAGRRGETPRKVDAPAELTSRVPSYEIRDMLVRLNRKAGEPEAVDLLVASNMISVGMDIPRLGMMIVDAQPKSLSEYIQATSRVGRATVPGLIVTMYNATRPRDRSHYETFDTWHRCLYRDVEATSVTPFASRAQDKGLHAVLVALVRHMIPEMAQKPVLDDLRRQDAERVAVAIEERVARVDPSERANVSQKLRRLLDEWNARPDLQAYWDDYGKRTSLLMSAEQFAAKADLDEDLQPEGAARALWPTPNSMREVEPGAPFVLRPALRSEDS